MSALAIDLYCGLGGWTEGLLAEGWDVVGFDIERHAYGEHRYPAQLVLQDVRSIDGAQFRNASLIVASSPCQEFSYRAMPWKRAKALGPPLLGMELFAQAERIQREAIAAAGRFVPMVQENVRGAQKYVGRARWHYGSFYLWGDVPALMPITFGRGAVKAGDRNKGRTDGSNKWTSDFEEAAVRHIGESWRSKDFATIKNMGGSWFNVGHPQAQQGRNPDGRLDGVKQGGDWFNAAALDRDGQQAICRRSGSKSPARKAASARIAKIPLELARHIAAVYYPRCAAKERTA